MNFIEAVAGATVVAMAAGTPAAAQVGNPATPHVGRPMASPVIGPPAPPVPVVVAPRSGVLPTNLTLAQALEEAGARSPAVTAAEREVAAAQARVRQAGYRDNPELSLEVENVAGTGELRGLRRMEATVAVNQRLDLSGRRSARVEAARADLAVQQLRFAIARADVAQSVHEQFARAIAARERRDQANDNAIWAQELARIAGILVDAGRDPPLRSVRARSALAQAIAAREVAEADELAARSSLAALLGASTPILSVWESSLLPSPRPVGAEASLDVRLADAERSTAQAGLQQQLTERRLDPAVGAGVRHVRETGDFGLVAGLSMPLRVFDGNQGNIAAARAVVAAADAKRAGAMATATAKASNASVNVQAAQRRVNALEKSAIPEAAEGLRLTQRSYQEGRASLLELLDARNAYTSAQTSLTEARLALALATAELARVSAQ